MILYNKKLLKKAKNIRVVLTDVDGVLTDGKIYYGPTGESQKVFHVLDGYGVRALMDKSVTIGVISGRNSQAVETRMKELGVSIVYQGIHDKLPIYHTIIKQLGVEDSQVAYIGDDNPDIPILSRVGLSVTVNNASSQLKYYADFCTAANGGMGAFREMADLILQAKNGL